MDKITRDPGRVELMLEVLGEAWGLYPDMRLGQLLCVCAGTASLGGVEDDVLLSGLRQYIDKMKTALGSGSRAL